MSLQKIKTDKSKRSSTSSVKTAKFQLRKEEAALQAKLAFAEEERKLKVEQRSKS